MGFTKLDFSKNWNNPEDFPTVETNEFQVREDMQLLHDETRKALNNLMDALERGGQDNLVRYTAGNLRYIRLREDKGVEVSADGNTWVAILGSDGSVETALDALSGKVDGVDDRLFYNENAVNNIAEMLSILDNRIDQAEAFNPIDRTLEQGTNGLWTYIKKASGLAECWGVWEGTVNASKNNYQGFHYSDPISVAFPFSFIEAPTVHTDGGSTSAINFSREFGSTANLAKFNVVCLTPAQTSVKVKVSIRASGRWFEEQTVG